MDEEESTPKYPKIEIALSQGDGNAMVIMGNVRSTMRRAGVPKEEIEAYSTEARSGDYDNVIKTTMRWVSVY